MFVFGNHDAYGLKNGNRVFDDEAVVRREAIEADPRRAWDACFHEEWKPYFAKSVEATIPLGVLPEGASSVCVTPLDSFGTPGRPLAAPI